MKLKVKVIQVSLANNKVGNRGDVIDHTQLPVPANWPTLVEQGYLEHTKESLKELEKAEKQAAKEAAKKEKADKEAKKAKKKAKKEAKKKAKAAEGGGESEEETKDVVDLDNDLDDSDNKEPTAEELLEQQKAALQEMNKEELVAYAEENEIEVNKRDKKGEIFAAIVASLEVVDAEEVESSEEE